MTGKTLLVLAASEEQVDAIRTAQRMGCRVVTVDNVPSNPGHALADAWYDVDTTDVDRVFEIACRERVSGLLAFATDVAVPTAATVAARLGLPGVPPSATAVLCGKHSFRRFLSATGLPTPRFQPVSADRALTLEGLGRGPWVLKPERSSGSKGVFVASTEADVLLNLSKTLAYDPDGLGIVEDFIEGQQGTCEGWLRSGRIERMFVFGRETVGRPHTATAGHRFPATLSAGALGELERQLEVVFEKLGIRSGPFDCDFVSQGDESTLLEASPRLGGNGIWRLVREVRDLDLLELAVRHAIGEKFVLPQETPGTAGAILILGVQRPGRVSWDEEEAKHLLAEPWVRSLTLEVERGREVPQFDNGRHKLGSAILVASSPDEIDRFAREFRARLALTTT